MQSSKLALVLAAALASTGAIAADAVTRDDHAATAASGRTLYQAGERAKYFEQEKARLERQGFPQYNP
jgi:hypothetical protein